MKADYFSIERMEKALNGPEIEIPEGLTKEQLRDFLISDQAIELHKKKKGENTEIMPDFNTFEEFDDWLNTGNE